MSHNIYLVLNKKEFVDCFNSNTDAKDFVKDLEDIVDKKDSITINSISENETIHEWAKTNFKPDSSLSDAQFKEYCDSYYKRKRAFEKQICQDYIQNVLTTNKFKIFEKYYEHIFDPHLNLSIIKKEVL